jgi:hypothetical protein
VKRALCGHGKGLCSRPPEAVMASSWGGTAPGCSKHTAAATSSCTAPTIIRVMNNDLQQLTWILVSARAYRHIVEGAPLRHAAAAARP